MAEITQEAIVEALANNEELMSGVTQHLIQTEKGKEIINNRASQLYTENIGEEIRKVHTQYDDDMFEVLGEKPGTDENGNKIKSYVFAKSKFEELKGLRAMKDKLNESEEVKRLQAENEKLKAGGGGEHWKQTYNEAKTQWQGEKKTMQDEINKLQKDGYNSTVNSELSKAKSILKFNPDYPQSVIDTMYNMHKNDLIANSKKEGDNIVFLTKEGKIITDSEYKPASAEFILKERMKDVLLTEKKVPGGGAQEEVKGSIKTTKVEGKDDQKSLVLDATQFKTRVEFLDVAKKALKAEGITRSNPLYQKLIDNAHKEYNVQELPRN